jgi:hypothetical protein
VRRTLQALLAAAVLASATTGAASWVTAGEPLSNDADPESTVSERERSRDALLDPTFDVLAQLPGFQVGGLDPKLDEIVVYWNDEFGPEAQAAVDEADRRGVPVNVVSVSYSYDELREIAGPLVDALAAKGIELEGYRIGDPFDEIAVWGHALDESADARRVAEDTAADTLPSDIKLAIITGPGELIPADSRHADGGQPTPGNGFEVGSLPSVPKCSSALGWEDPGFRFYMESAAHCVHFANNETVQFDGNPYNAGTYSGYIGTLVGNPNSLSSSDVLLDATLIGVPATPSIAGEMFFGSNTSSSKQDIPSIGSVPLNATLCTNGSATGTHCNAKRTSSAVSRLQLCSGVCRYIDVVEVLATNASVMFGQGDSGGHLYRLSDHRVVATISALNVGYPCGPINYYSQYALCTNTQGWVTSVAGVASELDEENPDLEPRLRP